MRPRQENESDSTLLKAIKEGNISEVQSIAEKKTEDINRTLFDHGKECTALIFACLCGITEIIHILLLNGADVNTCTSLFSPLIVACVMGKVANVILLLQHGAEVDKTISGKSALHLACKLRNLDIVKTLLENKAQVDLRRDDKSTSLMIACVEGDADIVELLLNYRAKVDTQNRYNLTPLLTACFSGSTKIVKLLVERNAPINVYDVLGNSPLMVATGPGHTKIIKILLDNNADVNFERHSDKKTSLMEASSKGHAEIAKLLLKYGAEIDKRDGVGATALIYASRDGHVVIVKILLDRGAMVNVQTKTGETALMCACVYGNSAIVQLLLEHGANPTLEAKNGPFRLNAILIAKTANHPNILDILLGRPPLRDAFLALLPLTQKWKTIAVILEFSAEDIERIDNETDDSGDALRVLLTKWLNRDNPQPTWKLLSEAVQNIDTDIAQSLLHKHSVPDITEVSSTVSYTHSKDTSDLKPDYSEVKHFSLEQIEVATASFDPINKIGEGAFGEVFKGVNFVDPGIVVVIKKLSKKGKQAIHTKVAGLEVQGAHDQLDAELRHLTKLEHPNVVELKGYHDSPKCTALVYEFVERGSLYDNLHKMSSNTLTWDERECILKGTCSGLCYLHDNKIAHQDIKSPNILVTGDFQAKLADFGFAVQLKKQEFESCTKTIVTLPVIARTIGYCAPEVLNGHYSLKSDVYSYGIVVLETFTGLKAYDKARGDDSCLFDHVEDNLHSLKDFESITCKEICGSPSEQLLSQLYTISCEATKKLKHRPTSHDLMKYWDEVEKGVDTNNSTCDKEST